MISYLYFDKLKNQDNNPGNAANRELASSKKNLTTPSVINEQPPLKALANVKENKIHIIKKGDTLYSLAIKYGTTVDNLLSLNDLSAKKKLKIGFKLRLE